VALLVRQAALVVSVERRVLARGFRPPVVAVVRVVLSQRLLQAVAAVVARVQRVV
jgi:hypothetical protein